MHFFKRRPHLGNARKNAYFLGKPSLSAEDIIGKSLTKALKNIKNMDCLNLFYPLLVIIRIEGKKVLIANLLGEAALVHASSDHVQLGDEPEPHLQTDSDKDVKTKRI